MSEPHHPSEGSSGPPERDECSAVAERLQEFVDGELPGALDTEVREHLALCDACRGAAAHQRAFLRRLARAGEQPPAPETLRARIQALLRERS